MVFCEFFDYLVICVPFCFEDADDDAAGAGGGVGGMGEEGCWRCNLLFTMTPVELSVFFAMRGTVMPCSSFPSPCPFQPMFCIIFLALSSLLPDFFSVSSSISKPLLRARIR